MRDVDPQPEHANLVAAHYKAVAVRGHEVLRYSKHYACFVCRRAFKHPEVCDRNGPSREPPRSRPCPECGGPARSMGMNFKPPRREATNQWRKLELLASRGELFHSYGARPRTLADAKQQERERGRGR
jgi:hypothetical protein